jgi:small-conductance mechanosensitive channel
MAVTSRVLAAVLGGYLVAALASVSLSLWLPMARAEAVVIGMLTSFLAYLVAVLWCFACRSAWRAWLGLIVPSLVLAALSGLAYWMGHR